MTEGSLKLNIIANTVIEPGMSGGNRIFIEYAKRWIKTGTEVSIFTSNTGKELCKKNGLTDVQFFSWKLPLTPIEGFNKFTVFLFYILGTFKGCIVAFRKSFAGKNIIYSSSDYWPDFLPGFIMKWRNKEAKWIAGFYLFAPKPWQKDSPYKGKRWFIGLFYWLTQFPIYWLVKRFADMVFVTSEPDVEKFVTKKRGRDKVIVIRGGVDIRPSEKHLNSGDIVSVEKRKYDACFVGRFHCQKGVLELIDIWRYVCNKKPEAKLAMIGIGPLETEIKRKIKRLGLQNNIELLGFKDGEEKYEIFKQSKIVVHPATYDSGGMAACEAMAWGLPGVSFDLEALRTYYPKGMIKTPCYDLKKFAENILLLLKDKKLYDKVSKEARDWAEEWDWDEKAKEILQKIKNCLIGV